MNEDVKKIYEYACEQCEKLDEVYEQTKMRSFQHQQTGVWMVKNMIEVNFIDNETN